MQLPEKYKWLDEIGTLPKLVNAAIQYLGIREVVGKGSNPVIMNMAKELNVADIYTDDDMSWCALFINYLCKITGKPIVDIKGDKYNLLRAKWLLNWGNAVPIKDMQLGDIGVLNRDGGGHVFIIIAKAKNGNVIGIGGNQSNSVTFSEFDIKRLVGVRRYYATKPPESAKQYIIASDGKLSTNES